MGPSKMAAIDISWLHFSNNRSSIQSFFEISDSNQLRGVFIRASCKLFLSFRNHIIVGISLAKFIPHYCIKVTSEEQNRIPDSRGMLPTMSWGGGNMTSIL